MIPTILRRCLPFVVFIISSSYAQVLPGKAAALSAQAKNVTIIRDNFGVPHIYGKTDADASFGLLFAMCEDNYWQLEEDFIKYTGQMARLYGDAGLQNDVWVKLFSLEKRAKARLAASPSAIRKIVESAAAGMNYYLYKNPEVPRRLITVYEPWMWLITDYPTLSQLGIDSAFKTVNPAVPGRQPEGDPDMDWVAQQERGSNAIAIGPAKSENGNTMLLINPHVAFFGDNQRYEAHLASQEGLNASGFAFLGGAFLWSGFNDNLAWTHTNTATDKEDAWIETFDDTSHPLQYRYNNGYRTATTWSDTVYLKGKNGETIPKIYVFHATHHGPVVATANNLKIACTSTELEATGLLHQCWRMMKAQNLTQFTSAMAMRQLGYPTTTYADRLGNIVYWHGNAIPKRNPAYNWKKPVDGSTVATEWQGLHDLKDIVQVKNPKTGYVFNTNGSPFLAGGRPQIDSLRFPYYMAPDVQNFRALEALSLLGKNEKLNAEKLRVLSTSPNIPMMQFWLPKIIAGYDSINLKKPFGNATLAKSIDSLRRWNYHYDSAGSATTIAVSWYLTAMKNYRATITASIASLPRTTDAIPFPLTAAQGVDVLVAAINDLTAVFGSPFVPWGNINRLQRIHSSGKNEAFSDARPSLSVSAVPGTMGSLFAFIARSEKGQRNLYGTYGNSYVAIIDFPKTAGARIKPRSVVYFGQNADPGSPHYLDQAPIYAKGLMKPAWFYKDDVRKHAEKTYHPGQ